MTLLGMIAVACLVIMARRGDVVLRQGATTSLSPALVRSERHVRSIRLQEIDTYGDGVRRCPSGARQADDSC